MSEKIKWIVWGGGESPVPAGNDVSVNFRDGTVDRDKCPELWEWEHHGDDEDIVAYFDHTAAEEAEKEAQEVKPDGTKQERYLDEHGEDWIDECARTLSIEEFRAGMAFTIGKYQRRMGKKDAVEIEQAKIDDYRRRWAEVELKRVLDVRSQKFMFGGMENEHK